MAQPRMFAADTNVSYASDCLDEIQNVINSELENLNSWLIANRLSLNKNRIYDNRITTKNECYTE